MRCRAVKYGRTHTFTSPISYPCNKYECNIKPCRYYKKCTMKSRALPKPVSIRETHRGHLMFNCGGGQCPLPAGVGQANLDLHMSPSSFFATINSARLNPLEESMLSNITPAAIVDHKMSKPFYDGCYHEYSSANQCFVINPPREIPLLCRGDK